MIVFPLLRVAADTIQYLVDAPGKAIDAASSVAVQAVNAASAIPAKVIDAVTINPLEWFTDVLLDWKEAAFAWLANVTPYGLAVMASLWIARSVMRRQAVRHDATWLRWSVTGNAPSIAANLSASGHQVRCVDDNVLLVNAWDSGNVARALQAKNIHYEVIR